MSGAAVTPWWEALRIRTEVVDASGQIDDVQMSLYQTVYGEGTLRPPYADATYYGEITHPTTVLVDLLASVAVRLGGGPDYSKAGTALRRPDQGMGGGKSHALIGAYHLAANPTTFASTDIGKKVHREAERILGRAIPTNLNDPVVVVLPCDSMTPGAPDDGIDGPALTLYQRFLWRLFQRDFALYDRYRPFFNNKAKLADALRAVNRPVLILIDEIMNYLGNASDGDSVLAGQDLEFLRALTDVVNDVPNVAGLIVMISSEIDPMAQSPGALERRADVDSLLERNGSRAPVTENSDFAAILRRRLFDQPAPAEVVEATARAFMPILTDSAWTRTVWSAIGGTWQTNFEKQVGRCYPFHPQLMELAENEWAEVSGFQRVRSTIGIFAATVYALRVRASDGGWAPMLIGPGDLPLSDATVREAILNSGLIADERSVSNYRSLAENEVVTLDDTRGAARTLDQHRDSLLWGEANPRAAERGATYVFLTSIVGHRSGGKRGASAPEVKAALVVPDLAFALVDADGVVEDLVDPDRGMSAVEVIPGQGNNKPARYYLSTRLTHRMLVNNLRRTVTDLERDRVLAQFAERLANTGPFKKKVFIAADPARSPAAVLGSAGIDDARTTRLIILDPSQFSLRNGMEQDTLSALTAAFGLGTGKDRMPIEWASSAVFAVVNTQRRSLARTLATEYIARERALGAPEVQADTDLRSTGINDLADAKDKLEKAVRRAFQHVVYLAQPGINDDREIATITLEEDNQSALDGTQVWKALVDREKAFDAGQFSDRALVHNLRDADYDRPLSEVRDAFWSAPRLPLLHSGERDLQNAVFDAVRAGTLRIIGGDGVEVIVVDAGQVNLGSTSLRLARPSSAVNVDHPEDDTGVSDGGKTDPDGQPDNGDPATIEKFVTFPLVGNLLDDPEKSDRLAGLFRLLYAALDERQVSYAQGTVQLVVTEDLAVRLASQVEALGLRATVRDQ